MRYVLFPTMILVFVAPAAFGGPDAITYQGSLLDSIGGPVPDGTYRMQFKLYDAAVAGANQWTEAQNVEVIRGLFSTALGRTTPLHRVFMKHPDLWLEVTVDVDQSGTFEPGEVYTPRQNLAGAPWACPRVEPNDICPNLIGGHSANSVQQGSVGATIGGGGFADRGNIDLNQVTDDYGTVGGGANNIAGDGDDRTTSAKYATVGGGWANTAGEFGATVGGGRDNTASGFYATVPGGYHNSAEGLRSLAAGSRAKALHRGSFVWADNSSGLDFESQLENQFRVRADGGTRFDVNNNHWVSIRYVQTIMGTWVIFTSTGAGLTASGIWTNSSDRARKENFAPVDGRDVLARLAQVPISTWNHKNDEASVRHMGPVAQDLYAAFGLGDSDKSIATIDADGVSMAAIQGLYEIVKEKDARIADLETRLAAVEAALQSKGLVDLAAK